MRSEEAEDAIADLAVQKLVGRPHSAIELGCKVLWSEDLAAGRRYGTLTVQNPFA